MENIKITIPIKNFFIKSYYSGKEFVTSTITVEEYAIVPYREKNEKLLHDFDMLLEDTGTDIIDITKPIAKKAAEIRAYYSKFKAMDALQLAAASN